MGALSIALAGSFFYLGLLYVAVLFGWCVYRNFVSAEEDQPLDYFSNSFRATPPLIVVLLILFAGVAGWSLASGNLQMMIDYIPELLIIFVVEGVILATRLILAQSAACALAGMAIYIVIGAFIVVIVLVPTMPSSRPGVLYAGAFILANVPLGVLMQAYRLGSEDDNTAMGQKWKLPDGFDNLAETWAKTIFKASGPIFIISMAFFGVEELFDKGMYGLGFAGFYYLTAFFLLCGCCKEYVAE